MKNLPIFKILGAYLLVSVIFVSTGVAYVKGKRDAEIKAPDLSKLSFNFHDQEPQKETRIIINQKFFQNINTGSARIERTVFEKGEIGMSGRTRVGFFEPEFELRVIPEVSDNSLKFTPVAFKYAGVNTTSIIAQSITSTINTYAKEYLSNVKVNKVEVGNGEMVLWVSPK